MERIQSELRDLRGEVRDLHDGQVVLTDMVFRLARDMVRVKELLGRMDARITQLERTPT